MSIKGGYTARALFVRSSLQNMDEEELPELVVVCARPVLHVTIAPRAVPSDARHDGWYGPDGRENLATHTTEAQLHHAGLLIGRLIALS